MFGVVLLQLSILDGTNEQRVHSHGINREETSGDNVSADHNQQQRNEVVVQFRNVFLGLGNAMGEEEVGQNADASRNTQFAQKDEEIAHFVDYHQTNRIGNDQMKSATGRGEESGAVNSGNNICITIEKLQESFQTKQTTTAATE